MSEIKTGRADPFFFERQKLPIPHFTAQDYQQRIDLLIQRMKERGIEHVVIYGDREHFSNIEYFSSYDCRFEESLLIIDDKGNKYIVVGNEGYGYSFQIPYEIKRLFYQHFSLQGQPREDSPNLSDVFRSAGICHSKKVGVVGYKYFYQKYTADPKRTFDLPEYILNELREAAGEDIINFTEEITGLPNGIRMKIHNPKEVAWAEYNATKCADVILNMIDGMEEGIEEIELSRRGRIDFSPVCMFGLVNFGARNLSVGLRSPDDTKLKAGEVCSLCYGTRGSLYSRSGVAAYDENSYSNELKPTIDRFYKPFWSAIAAWYEAMRDGARAGDVYEAVMNIIGGPEFGVTLNPGHNIGMDEWTNSPIYKNSELPIESGAYMQSDIIGSSKTPVQSAICEDTVVIAGKELRQEIKEFYPEMYERICQRQRKMREVLGIHVDDSLLPMSNLNGVYFPFLMNKEKIFVK